MQDLRLRLAQLRCNAILVLVRPVPLLGQKLLSSCRLLLGRCKQRPLCVEALLQLAQLLLKVHLLALRGELLRVGCVHLSLELAVLL